MQRLEKGESGVIRMSDIEGLCEIYDDAESLAALRGLADEANSGTKDWWHQYQDAIDEDFGTYLSLEANATKLTMYQSVLCPGLIQTRDYARALYQLSDRPGEEIEDGVEVRARRQKLITRPKAPIPVDIVLDESVLHRVVGNPKVMAGQIRHLADLPENVELRIVPLRAPYPLWGNAGPYVVLEFPDEPTVVYVENYRTDIYYERPRTVHSYRRAHAEFRRVALNPTESKRLLRRVAREYKP